MRRIGVIPVLAFLFVSILALAQQPTTSTASIEGIVVLADSGEPVSGAQVVLSGGPTPNAGQRGARGAVPAPPTATTGADGKFSFKNLAAGSYGLITTANGFVSQQYGQLALFGSGRRISLTAGQVVKDAAFRLTTTGTVRIRVFDESAQPAIKASIQLIRPVYGPMGRTLQVAGEGSTDERGEFRVLDITPGRYYLSAGTQPGAGTAVPRYTFVYYPNSPEPEQAMLLEVNAGVEMAVDMRVRRQNKTYRVRGRIVDSRGTPLPSSLRITISVASRQLITSRDAAGRILNSAIGAFEFQNVLPGEYIVHVQDQNTSHPPAGQTDRSTLVAQTAARLGGQTMVRVIDEDIIDLVVPLARAITTNGHITVEGQSIPAPGTLDSMRLIFSPAVPVFQESAASSPAKPNSSFEVSLQEGEFRVQVFPVPPGFYVKSIDYGGTNILGKFYSFTASSVATFNVTIRSGAAQITGTVADVKSQPVQGTQVFLIPVDRGRMDLSRMAYTDQNGRFTFPSLIPGDTLTPGDYKIFSWEAADTGAAYDPDFMKQYETQTPVTHVAERSNQTVNVRLIPKP